MSVHHFENQADDLFQDAWREQEEDIVLELGAALSDSRRRIAVEQPRSDSGREDLVKDLWQETFLGV